MAAICNASSRILSHTIMPFDSLYSCEESAAARHSEECWGKKGAELVEGVKSNLKQSSMYLLYSQVADNFSTVSETVNRGTTWCGSHLLHEDSRDEDNRRADRMLILKLAMYASSLTLTYLIVSQV